MTNVSFSVAQSVALGFSLVVRVQYPDSSGEGRNVYRTLTRVVPSRTRRPYREISWLGKRSGLTEEGAKRVLIELDNDVNEGRATLVEINDDEVAVLRRSF